MQQNSVISDILTNLIVSKLNRTDSKMSVLFNYKNMKSKEEKICSFTQNGTRLQLLKITNNNYENVVEEITNSVGGYIMLWSDGQKQHIKDNDVEEQARLWGLKKDNENYYYKERIFKGEINVKYQVRLNRKIIDTSISEYQMRKVFATYCQNIILQLKIY